LRIAQHEKKVDSNFSLAVDGGRRRDEVQNGACAVGNSGGGGR